VLMGSQSVLGLSLPGEYRDVEWIRATWFGNDWVTLILSLPLLGISLVLARRGAVRGQVLGLGMLGYSTYNYGFYLFVAALNAFFPLYAILLVLSVVPQLRIAPIPLRCWDFGPGRSPGRGLMLAGLEALGWRGNFNKAFAGPRSASDSAFRICIYATCGTPGRRSPLSPGPVCGTRWSEWATTPLLRHSSTSTAAGHPMRPSQPRWTPS